MQLHGRWVPEQHWPSVKYPPRNPAEKRYDRHARPAQLPEKPVLAESTSH
ncbi:MAG TPA: hypothetical protein VGJ21_00895 [Terracidiphilus sp.]